MNEALQTGGAIASQSYTIEGMMLVFGILIVVVILGVLFTMRSLTGTTNHVTNTITTILGSNLRQALDDLTKALNKLNAEEEKRNTKTVSETESMIQVAKQQATILEQLSQIARTNQETLSALKPIITDQIITDLAELKEITNGTKQLVEEKTIKMFEEKFQTLLNELNKLNATLAQLVAAREQDRAKIDELSTKIETLQREISELKTKKEETK